MTFDGAVRIDGKFIGEILSKGMLIIGEKAFIQANVQAGVVLIHGEARGKIQASTRVEAYSPARIHGDIYAPILVIGEGVVFQGSSHMIEKNEGSGDR